MPGLGPLAGPLDYLGTLRALIKPYLSSSYLSEQMAAKLMDTSVRTLRRRLSAHGTSYRAVLDEVRFRQAVSPEDARRHEADDLVRHLDASGALVLYVMGNDDLVELEPRWQRVQSLHGRRVEHGGFAFVGYQ